MFTLWRDVNAQNWGNAAFAAFNAFLASWAVVAYIGIGNSIVDIWLGVTKPLYVEKNRKRVAIEAAAYAEVLDWRSVLYHGHADGAVPLFDTIGSANVTAGAAVGADVGTDSDTDSEAGTQKQAA
jgi:hypothetical protein